MFISLGTFALLLAWPTQYQYKSCKKPKPLSLFGFSISPKGKYENENDIDPFCLSPSFLYGSPLSWATITKHGPFKLLIPYNIGIDVFSYLIFPLGIMQRSFQAFKHTLKLVVFRRGALDLIPKFLRKKRKEKFRLNMDNRVPPPSLLLYFILLFVSPSLSFTGFYLGFIVWGRSPEWPKATSFLGWSRGMPLPKIFEMNMCWDAIWCILRHNFEKYYSVCSELQWRFSYLIL